MKNFLSRLIPSYIDYWKKAFDFKSKTKRIDFWAATLTGVAATFLITLAISLIHMFPYDLSTIENFDSKELIQKSWLYAAWEAINGVPLFTMEIRRVRDAGAKSWVMALALSGLINTIFILIGGPLVPTIPPMPAARIALFVIGIPPLVYTFLPSHGAKSYQESQRLK